jgi:MoxR-like ATPase
MTRKQKISEILQRLQRGVYEKEEATKLSLLAALAGESIFLLGPPGVAKSLIARKLKFSFRDGRSFEYLMNRFSTPDEIFGPVSIKKLKDEDKYERLTDKYLPGANVVFLDEIWKAGPAIQNALLTVLNEKIYRNGEQEIKVNIKAIISASNELPGQSEGLTALWDRFLIRYMITEIRSSGNFVDMIVDTADVYEDSVEESLKIGEEELAKWDTLINSIEVPAEVLNVIQIIKYRLDEYDKENPETAFHVYDRRWKKIIRLLRTSAFLNERNAIDLMDCFLIPHCLWNRPEQFDLSREIVAEIIRKHGYSMAMNLTPLKAELRDFEEDVRKETQIPNIVLVDKPRAVDKEYYEILNIEQYFDGNRIKRGEFDRLGIDEENTINLYDVNGNLTNRVKARKSEENPNAIIINYNARLFTFLLLTDKAEKTEYIYKKPHPLVHKFWNEKANQLRQYMLEQKEFTKNNRPEALMHLRNNLFVDPALADIVETNLRESSDILDSLLIKLEKIKHLYESIK